MTAVIADSTPNTTPTVSASSSDEREPVRGSSSTPPASDSACALSGNRLAASAASVDIQPYQVLPYDPIKMNPNPPSAVTTTTTMTTTLTGDNGDSDSAGGCLSGRIQVTKQEFAPTVFTDTITTGGYR